jgi:hypothetical protein
MFDEVLRKVWSEILLLSLVVGFSLTVSMFLIVDAIIGLVLERYGLALTVLRAFELVFAVAWLFLCTSMNREINWLRKTLNNTYFVRKSEKIDEEQKKSGTTELVRNMIGFYRDNYLKFTVVLTLALAISFSIIFTATYLLLCGSMSFWATAFRWTFNSSILLITSMLYAYTHRGWRRKLSKVKEAEKELSEMLGGPIEA